MRLAALVLVAGCWTGSTPPSPTSGSASAPGHVDDAHDRPACIYDERARHRCNGRGSRFEYGPEPYIYCRGIPPEPGDQERAEAEARGRRCVCNELAEIQQRRLACSQIP